MGVPPVSASITNTVALVPGYLGATMAQVKDLAGQRRRLWLLVPTGVLGGIVGAFLLVQTDERLFRTLVPYMILVASGLLAFQDRLRRWVVQRSGGVDDRAVARPWWSCRCSLHRCTAVFLAPG